MIGHRVEGVRYVSVDDCWIPEVPDDFDDPRNDGVMLTAVFDSRQHLRNFRASELRNKMVEEGKQHGFKSGLIAGPTRQFVNLERTG